MTAEFESHAKSEANSPKEIERKFLIKDLPFDLDTFPHDEISQGYLIADNDSELRVRVKNGREVILGVKKGNGLVRDETEVELLPEQYHQLWPQTRGARVNKTRYKIPHNTAKIEVDVYKDELLGLKTAEIEFLSESESNDFAKPDWLGDEITEDARYKNKNLALKGMPTEKITSELVLNKVEGVDILISKIDELYHQKKGERPIVVLLSGRTSSGKTTAVTSEILSKFGENAVVLSMDHYQKGNSYIKKRSLEGVKINWDHPDYVDTDLLKEHVGQLLKGKEIDVPEYSFITGEREGVNKFSPQDIIVVEGLFALRNELAELGDVKAFVDISLHGSIIRRLLRDVTRTTMNPSEILKYYLETVEPMYRQFVEPTKKNADMVLINEYNPENEAGKAGISEIQAKYKGTINSEKLRTSGARFLGVMEQKDVYFNPDSHNLSESGENIRIRHEDHTIIMTYKGPRTGKLGQRPKFEFEIDEDIETVFKKSYGNNFKEINKTRKIYVIDGAAVTLDKVEKIEKGIKTDLGNFIEIQCFDEEKAEEIIDKISSLLNITTDKIGKSYSEM